MLTKNSVFWDASGDDFREGGANAHFQSFHLLKNGRTERLEVGVSPALSILSRSEFLKLMPMSGIPDHQISLTYTLKLDASLSPQGETVVLTLNEPLMNPV